MIEVQFRRVEAKDWSDAWPIFSEVVSAGDTYTYDPATDSDTAQGIWLGSGEVWILEQDGSAVGIYRVSDNQQGAGSHIANGSYMVASRARGRGLGRQMVVHSLQRARELGYRGMQFNAVASSNAGAVTLYHDLVFTTVGIVPEGFRHPTLGFVDLLIMFIAL